MATGLKRLRLEVRKTDLEILKAAKKRMRLAREIGRTKNKRGLPAVDKSVEDMVVGHALKASRKLGLNENFARGLVKLLIEESRRVQKIGRETSGLRLKPMKARKAAVIGGAGKMGQWFAGFLRDKGFKVVISGSSLDRTVDAAKKLKVKYASSNKEAVSDADLVVVATPISSTPSIISELHGYMKKDAILFDICSIKRGLTEALKDAQSYGIRAISIHPMFGPGTRSIAGRKILLVPVVDDRELLHEVAELFESEGAETYVIEDPESHDREMAYTLSLPQFLNILFSSALSASNINEVKKFGGTTFTLQLLIAETILQENSELLVATQIGNEAFHSLLERLKNHLAKLDEAVRKKDKEAFLRILMDARESLSKDSRFIDAYNRFCCAVEAVEA